MESNRGNKGWGLLYLLNSSEIILSFRDMVEQIGNGFSIVSSPDGFCKDHGDVDDLEKKEGHQVSIIWTGLTGKPVETDEQPNKDSSF